MKEKIVYVCDCCKKYFDSKQECKEHEEWSAKNKMARQFLKEGYTLSQINEECDIWGDAFPSYLEQVTKDYCFVIREFQGCLEPAYQIKSIDGINIKLGGKGCLGAYYDAWTTIFDERLKDVHMPKELYISKGPWEYL